MNKTFDALESLRKKGLEVMARAEETSWSWDGRKRRADRLAFDGLEKRRPVDPPGQGHRGPEAANPPL